MLCSICIIEFINTKQIARIRKFKYNDQKKKKKYKKKKKEEEEK